MPIYSFNSSLAGSSALVFKPCHCLSVCNNESVRSPAQFYSLWVYARLDEDSEDNEGHFQLSCVLGLGARFLLDLDEIRAAISLSLMPDWMRFSLDNLRTARSLSCNSRSVGTSLVNCSARCVSSRRSYTSTAFVSRPLDANGMSRHTSVVVQA